MSCDCDVLGYYPFNAIGGYDCRNFCGLGVDEDEPEEMDYSELDYDPM